jgi:DNA polymerase-3 subunit delta'
VARASRNEPAPESRLPGERLAWSGVPWLAAARRQVAGARRDGRLPHAILLHGPEGGGQAALALWTAQLALCESVQDEPCGHCGSCVLFLAGNHPDFHGVSIEEKATVIKVDQVRELCSTLAMKSFRGRAKVGLLEPADRMNINANNALLKTLEEPSQETLLILVASRLDRLARTVVSRCQRLRIRQPPLEEALAWLRSTEDRDDWPALLEMAAGAPLRALELAGSGTGELAREMAACIPPARAGGFDPLGLADAWSKDRPGDRLAWLENWLSGWIRAGAAVSDAVNNNRDNALPSLPSRLNMKAAFELLDRVREARALQEGSLNTLLLFEDLLVGFSEAFAGGIAARSDTKV